MSTPLTGNPHGGTPKGIDHLPGAASISEWLLLKNDLESVMTIAYVLNERTINSGELPADQLILRSLTRDMIVQFVACFQKNKFCNLDPDIVFERWPIELAYYRILEKLRNNYAAHRFGPQRQCRLVAYFEDGRPEDFGPVYVSFNVPERDDIMRLSRLTMIAIGVVDEKIKELTPAFFSQVLALTAEEISALREPDFDAPTASQFGMTRNEFRKDPKSHVQRPRPRSGGRSDRRP